MSTSSTGSSQATASPKAVQAYAAQSASSLLAPQEIRRREPTVDDVAIDILFCGVCHSDVHQARNDWRNTVYPCIPGHEIVGRVREVGSAVKRFTRGDLVGVGCMVDSCRTCACCSVGQEQYCENGLIATYNSPDRHLGGHTFGGYSDSIVVDQAYVLCISENLDPAAAAPLLCAGITIYSPLRHWGAGPGKKVGIVGIGGLGHMGVKFAHALGAHVVVFTTSPSKIEDAHRLGAHEVVLSTDKKAMHAHLRSFDFILDAVAAEHDINAYLALLKLDGTLTMVGLPETPLALNSFSLVWPRRQLAGSLIGGIAETQEMLDFCAQRGIVCDIETIAIQQINEAYERMLRSDVKYRFVIDMASLRQ